MGAKHCVHSSVLFAEILERFVNGGLAKRCFSPHRAPMTLSLRGKGCSAKGEPVLSSLNHPGTFPIIESSAMAQSFSQFQLGEI